MDVVLLGTGSADGWPNPFCECRSCRWALAAGEIRGQTAALVDGTVLIDCGPEAPRAALRCGQTLAGVRHILFTHGHFDHVGPAALLMRHWTERAEPIEVIGPPYALAQCRDWVGPDDPIRFREVRPGDELTLAGPHGRYTVRVLAAAHPDGFAGTGLLYDISRSGTRFLWATDTGPLPPATRTACGGAGYDAVFLEQTFGTNTTHGTDHHDLPAFAATVADLRASGAVLENTDVVAVHLSHFNPPGPELAAALRRCGARAGVDGEHIRVGRRRPPVRTLVLGGARSGKSVYAEALLADDPRVSYLATGGRRDDPEWIERVRVHKQRRPSSWRTVETTEVATELRTADASVLLDCLGTWLTARIDHHRGWDGGPLDGVHADIDELLASWRDCPAPVVAVSNEVGSGVVPDTASGRLFRDLLGILNMQVAALSDHTVLMVAGAPVPLRPARAVDPGSVSRDGPR